MSTATHTSYWTPGHIARECRCTPQAVTKAAVAAGIEPVLTVNGVGYFDDAARERLEQILLHGGDEIKASASAARDRNRRS